MNLVERVIQGRTTMSQHRPLLTQHRECQPVIMSDFLAYMQWKDEREEDRLEMERRHQDDDRCHQELMELQHRRLQQEQPAEEARRTAAARQEEQRKRNREIDRKLREAPQLPKMSGDTDVEIFLADFEEIPKERCVVQLGKRSC